jgi:hypothetical protein
MSKTFTVMKDDVANMILDTSSAFKTLAGGWINDAYEDANQRFYWQEMMVNDFTFASVIGTSSYSYPSTHTMLRPIKMFNITDGKEIQKWDLRKWWQERGHDYDTAVLQNGTPDKYVLDEEQSKIVLDPPPDAVKTYKLVYQKNVTALSGASDTTEITRIEPFLVQTAIAKGFAYYKQYDKADWWTQKAEMELIKISGAKNSTLEEVYQRYPSRNQAYRPGRRLLGDTSYDQI